MPIRIPVFIFLFFLLFHFHEGVIATAIDEANSEALSPTEKSPEMKILFLIVSSDDLPVFAELEKVWRSYMKLDPDHVEAYFVKSNPHLATPCELIGDTLWAKTTECFIPGMTTKTLLAMEFMLPRLSEFDYVIRTNLSSVFVFSRLFAFLKTLPKTECYAAHIDYGNYGNCCQSWGCGAGIYFSPDLIRMFVENKASILIDPFLYNKYDDVFFSYFFQTKKNIKLLAAPRTEYIGTKNDWLRDKPTFPEDAFHFRIKNGNPSLRLANDPFLLSQLVKMFYPSAQSLIAFETEEPETLVDSLTKKLAEDPSNKTVIFQLALAYEAQNNHEEAIKWFKSRIEKGDDGEEAWGSLYKIGEIFNSIGNWDQALHWYQKAYNKSPERAEPLFKICQHYHDANQNNLAHLYAKQGKQIHRPEEKVLFFSPDIYDYQLDEELSIVSFYTPYREDGREAADRLLLKRGIPDPVKDQTYRNMIHYAPVLKEAKIEEIKIHLPKIREEMNETYSPMNPSIIKTANGYRIICRTVNYIRRNKHDFILKDPLETVSKTRNFLIDYDSAFNVISQKEIVENFPRKWKAQWEGLEDCRIFIDNQQQEWFTCASIGTHPLTIGQSLCKLGTDISESTINVDQLIPLKGPNDGRCEKNWLPFIKDNQLLMIYSYDPFIIYKIDQKTGAHETVVFEQPLQDYGRFRGSAAPIEFDGGYLLVVHEVVPDAVQLVYMHRLIQLNTELKMTKVSKPFFFKQKELEYCSGMTIDHSGKNLLLTMGINDGEAYLVTIDLDSIRSLLK